MVVALASDPAAVSAGAAESERLGVPILLDDGSGAKPAAGGTTTPSAAPDGTAAPGASDTPAAPEGTGAPDGSAAPASDPAVTEVTRLKPASVLALGAGVADRLGVHRREVVTDPGPAARGRPARGR